MNTDDVLFVARGAGVPGYYRCMLPAMSLGTDWTGVVSEPPKLRYRTGIAKKGKGVRDSSMPEFTDYEIVVVQQPSEMGWFGEIDRLKKAGVKVIYEVDDYLHGVPKVKSHGYKANFDKKMLGRVEAMIGMCDGLITSTEFIAKKYRKFNPNVHVCENALDLERYKLTLPERETVNIGWAGATGHREALMPWLVQVAHVMKLRENTTFITIGQPWARVLTGLGIPEERVMSIPFAAVEQYPAAMTMMDIAIAPAGRGSFFRGKSDLRWLEAGALGIPIIADPFVYGKIEDGVNGWRAEDPMQMSVRLLGAIDNAELRTTVGHNAQEYVREHRAFPEAGEQWRKVLETVA